jgi:hypothetical protein
MLFADRQKGSLAQAGSTTPDTSNHSQVNVDRSNSGFSSMFTESDTMMKEPSSSVATTLDRDDSYSSRKFLRTPELSQRSVLGEKAALGFPDTVEPMRMETDQSLHLHPEFEGDDDIYDTDSEGDDRYVDFSLLSHIAMRLRDKVPRETHVKGSIPYPRAFTGKDIVVSLQSFLQKPVLT